MSFVFTFQLQQVRSLTRLGSQAKQRRSAKSTILSLVRPFIHSPTPPLNTRAYPTVLCQGPLQSLLARRSSHNRVHRALVPMGWCSIVSTASSRHTASLILTVQSYASQCHPDALSARVGGYCDRAERRIVDPSSR